MFVPFKYYARERKRISDQSLRASEAAWNTTTNSQNKQEWMLGTDDDDDDDRAGDGERASPVNFMRFSLRVRLSARDNIVRMGFSYFLLSESLTIPVII